MRLIRLYQTRCRHRSRGRPTAAARGRMPDSTIDIVKAIRSRTLKASERPSITDQLRHAAHAGEIDACFNVLGRGCDVNNRADGKGKWKSGNTAMHIAAGQGHSSVINLLLEFRADTTVKNMDAELPLHLAARAGHTNCVMVLLEAERSKQPHVRRMERNLERPRVRTRDLVTSGRFRLPPTFALSSQTLRAAITSTKSFIEMAHAEKNESSKKDGLAPGGKFAINNSQFLEFSVAEVIGMQRAGRVKCLCVWGGRSRVGLLSAEMLPRWCLDSLEPGTHGSTTSRWSRPSRSTATLI